MQKIKLKIPFNETFISQKNKIFFKNLSKKFNISFYECFDGCTWNGGRLGKQTIFNNEVKDFLRDIPSNFMFVFTNNDINENNICIETIEEMKKLNKKIEFVIKDKNYLFFKELKEKFDANLCLSIIDYEKNFNEDIFKYEINEYTEYLYNKFHKYNEIVIKNEILLLDNKDIIKLKNRFDFNKFTIIYNQSEECYFCPLYQEHHLLGNYNNIFEDQLKFNSISSCLIPQRQNEIKNKFFANINFRRNMLLFKNYKFVDRRSPFNFFKKFFQDFLKNVYLKK